MTEMYFGNLTGSAIGIIMKEAVRRVIIAINGEMFFLEQEKKIGYSGKHDDFVTSADKLGQEIYVKMFSECLPLLGIIAEENELKVHCRLPDVQVYITVDPLDGTKAAIRRQSFGIGTMVALVYNGQAIAAYVGDVMTQEIYGFRPGSENVHRISKFDIGETLIIDTERKLRDQYLLLRAMPRSHSIHAQKLMTPLENGGLFADVETTSGSIGIHMARLWKGEVGGTVLDRGWQTPWDFNPFWGISQQLRFVFIKIDPRSGDLILLKPTAFLKKQKNDFETLIIHESRLPELRKVFEVK